MNIRYQISNQLDTPVLIKDMNIKCVSVAFRYEYFMRTVPPDRFQEESILDLLVHFNWTYVSLVFSEGNHGEGGAKIIENGIKSRKLCLAVNFKIPSDVTKDEMDRLGSFLISHKNARAVILLLNPGHIEPLFSMATSLGIQNHFIWISSDTLSYFKFGKEREVQYDLG